MLSRRWVYIAAIAALQLSAATRFATAAPRKDLSIRRQLPATSALCIVSQNVLQLDTRILRMQRRISGQAPPDDIFVMAKMMLGPYWDTAAPVAWVIPTPRKAQSIESRRSLVILRATDAAKFIAGFKTGATKGGITPGAIRGGHWFMTNRGNWIFLSTSSSTLKAYLKGQSGLKLSADMRKSLAKSDLAIEGDTAALRKILSQPTTAMALSQLPVNKMPLGSAPLGILLHELDAAIARQTTDSTVRSLLTADFGRRAMVYNLTVQFKADSSIVKVVGAQSPLPANALAGLPSVRYNALYADSINGAAVAHWLGKLLPARHHAAQPAGSHAFDPHNAFQTCLHILADHTGSSAVMLARPSAVSPTALTPGEWDGGPALILIRTQHPLAQLHRLAKLAACGHSPPAPHAAATRSAGVPAIKISNVQILGLPTLRIDIGPAGVAQPAHHVEIIKVATHRLLACVDTTSAVTQSAIKTARMNVSAIIKRPGLAQSMADRLPGSFMVAYLPIARWSQSQGGTAAPKAANALTLGLPPPPAVFSVAAGKQSLKMQMVVPMATMEQCIPGSPGGGLF